jgi:hypothetical protein
MEIPAYAGKTKEYFNLSFENLGNSRLHGNDGDFVYKAIYQRIVS